MFTLKCSNWQLKTSKMWHWKQAFLASSHFIRQMKTVKDHQSLMLQTQSSKEKEFPQMCKG